MIPIVVRVLFFGRPFESLFVMTLSFFLRPVFVCTLDAYVKRRWRVTLFLCYDNCEHNSLSAGSVFDSAGMCPASCANLPCRVFCRN